MDPAFGVHIIVTPIDIVTPVSRSCTRPLTVAVDRVADAGVVARTTVSALSVTLSLSSYSTRAPYWCWSPPTSVRTERINDSSAISKRWPSCVRGNSGQSRTRSMCLEFQPTTSVVQVEQLVGCVYVHVCVQIITFELNDFWPRYICYADSSWRYVVSRSNSVNFLCQRSRSLDEKYSFLGYGYMARCKARRADHG